MEDTLKELERVEQAGRSDKRGPNLPPEESSKGRGARAGQGPAPRPAKRPLPPRCGIHTVIENDALEAMITNQRLDTLLTPM